LPYPPVKVTAGRACFRPVPTMPFAVGLLFFATLETAFGPHRLARRTLLC
jgi:hypothetical protein